MIISWNTTNKCNMFCKHCYRDSGTEAQGELTLEEGKELLNEIAKAGFKIVIFSGGEPLMLPYIFDLVEHAVSVDLRPVFGTNGTLLNEETAIRLKKAGAMGMGISIDSLDRKKHDDFRGLENSWDKTVAGMKACKKAGLPFQVHSTVMNWNMDEIIDLTDFAVEMGAVAHHIFFLVPTGRAVNIEEESLRTEQYEQLLTKIIMKQQQVKIELKPTCAPQFMRIAKEMGINLRFARGCLAGTHYCIISPTGEVQPCAYINQSVGNVRKTPFSQIWANSSIFNELRTMNYKGGCGKCKYKVACGGCRARAAFYNNGDFMAEEPWCLYRSAVEE
ncbi:putative heme d1 biosynthesis radical SAM protein NirJ2 [Pseudobacteroides cellulosolvens]|uniref:4Fe4S-binding SPASM domain containing protein n=1 Tax=Pseudobacteroides cellulosolvens ATCC 35603 = DSM 2933 TaxID=398512 RepID=A0A0L6JQJ2_9FIRM|nr:putative heme d1 biosynthesis radical SAM protein NirJ2 [Pseudobacteroides cellulosolvens]KNY28059.1 4Fe4S-binding SPASM domain containing protein [Pseudobacteroides cellulosolvens ATCC 35603 = DSM 2933]